MRTTSSPPPCPRNVCSSDSTYDAHLTRIKGASNHSMIINDSPLGYNSSRGGLARPPSTLPPSTSIRAAMEAEVETLLGDKYVLLISNSSSAPSLSCTVESLPFPPPTSPLLEANSPPSRSPRPALLLSFPPVEDAGEDGPPLSPVLCVRVLFLCRTPRRRFPEARGSSASPLVELPSPSLSPSPLRLPASFGREPLFASVWTVWTAHSPSSPIPPAEPTRVDLSATLRPLSLPLWLLVLVSTSLVGLGFILSLAPPMLSRSRPPDCRVFESPLELKFLVSLLDMHACVHGAVRCGVPSASRVFFRAPCIPAIELLIKRDKYSL